MKRALVELAAKSVLPLAVLLALSVLVQAYLAGVAAVVDPDYWSLHKTWIAIFQWLSVVLAAATWAGRRDRTMRWTSFIPLAIIAAQYSSIHLALRHGVAWLAGLHAANGFLLLGVLVLFAARSRHVA
jgi:MFS-type transporter involved in bile tolerance (Atg22 family)